MSLHPLSRSRRPPRLWCKRRLLLRRWPPHPSRPRDRRRRRVAWCRRASDCASKSQMHREHQPCQRCRRGRLARAFVHPTKWCRRARRLRCRQRRETCARPGGPGADLAGLDTSGAAAAFVSAADAAKHDAGWAATVALAAGASAASARRGCVRQAGSASSVRARRGSRRRPCVRRPGPAPSRRRAAPRLPSAVASSRRRRHQSRARSPSSKA